MHKLIRNLIITTTSTLALTSAAVLSACGDDQAFDEPTSAASEDLTTPFALGLGDDWRELEKGLWTRANAEGEQQFAGIGEAGRQHAIDSLEEVEEGLKDMLASEERDETRQQLEELNVYITELRASEVPMTAEVSPRCTLTLSATVDAYPSSCGVSAKTSVSYSNCSNWGTVRSYAQASCGYETKSHSCGPKTGSPVACVVSTVSITGPGPCRSYGSVQINAPGVYVYVWDENFQRGECSSPGGTASTGGMCGPCSAGMNCNCGDICRPANLACP